MIIKTLNQISKLRKTFKFGGVTMVEWFEVSRGTFHVCIQSGLKHADGETKSPYHYEKVFVGKDCIKQAIKDFNEFLKNNIYVSK